jgi:tripartite-type tricarboxylate transporter receptor subunit TctC
MDPLRRQFLHLAAATTLLSTHSQVGWTQTYPTRPVTMIVPYGAGGPTDTFARILADGMREALGRPIIIENIAGASATIGVERAARATSDGYTVCVGNWASHVLNGAVFTLRYDVLKDFEPIAQIASGPQVIIARKDMPADTLIELITWLRQIRTRQRWERAAPAAHHMSPVFSLREIRIRAFNLCLTGWASAQQSKT